MEVGVVVGRRRRRWVGMEQWVGESGWGGGEVRWVCGRWGGGRMMMRFGGEW